MITKEILIEFFDELKEKKIEASDRLLWSYFFLDSDLNKLKEFSKKLETLGYRFKDIFEAEKIEDEHIPEYYLHVEKIQHHNIDTLNELNKFFYKMATENNIGSYDGFDVGPIISPENIK